MEIKQVLKNLCLSYGVSGDEQQACNVALKYLKPYAKNVQIDSFNNLIAVISEAKNGKPTILLDAHIDQIGMIITAIDDNGFIKVANCGGNDRRLLLGQDVIVLGKEKINGVICTIPVHTEDKKKVPKIDDVLIDVGMSKEEVQKIVSLGDRVIIDSEFNTLNDTIVSCRAIDDRSGVAVILKALDILKEEDLDIGLSVLFSSQEETGEQGATIAGYNINPDIVVAIDVSFAYTPDADEFKCGKMSKGGMIGISPTLNRKETDKIINLAKEKDISYQLEVMGGSTGTNADTLSLVRGGAKTVLLSIPQKYMHTPIEVVDLNDIENTAKLLAEYIRGFKEEI